MKRPDIVTHRLHHQQIVNPAFKKPEQLVQWMIAMQAQEYAMAKWAIGLRLPTADDAMVETAFNNGFILRTHLMRPTWHFVSPADIRWLLALTAPRVKAFNAFTYRQQQLDAKTFKRSHDTLVKALEGGKFLTRTALNEKLKQKKIIADGVRLSALMMEAELDGIICSGPRQGKQFTYALLEERVPPVKSMQRQDALAQFVQRYFTSRSPATLQDFAYWSGLTLKDARAGVESLPSNFIRETINGNEYIIDSSPLPKTNSRTSFLMPVYDEIGMSYKDRSAILNPGIDSKLYPTFNNLFITDGKIAGGWRRTVQPKDIEVETVAFITLNKKQDQALKKAVKEYKKFHAVG